MEGGMEGGREGGREGNLESLVYILIPTHQWGSRVGRQ